MNTLILLKSEAKLDNKEVVLVAKKIRSIFGANTIGKNIAKYNKVRSSTLSHQYIFMIEKDLLLEDEIEVMVSIFYHYITSDFELEFETDLPEIVVPTNDEIIVVSDSATHETWVMSQLKEGWSYGMEYDASHKINPLLRPYYQLTEKQKKKLK